MWDDILEKDKYILTNTPNREFEEYNGTLYYIKFLGLGRVGVCGGVVADISISWMSMEEEWTTEFHVWTRGSGEELTGGKYRAWVVIPTLNTRLLES